MTTTVFERRRDHYIVSSDPSLLDPSAINAAFGSKAMYWCTPLRPAALETMLKNSYCLGLYLDVTKLHPVGLATPPKPEQIGLARIITDFVTFAYLTDVYVAPQEQGKGLGNWLIECIGEVLDGMGDLRGAWLIASEGKGDVYYRKKLGMTPLEQGKNGICMMRRLGPTGFGYNEDDAPSH
ncbi:hypothetical protein MMC26_001694 [Xylographa opegraphella]|nr:hypothetical protein [Xylographa opegraphella]